MPAITSSRGETQTGKTDNIPSQIGVTSSHPQVAFILESLLSSGMHSKSCNTHTRTATRKMPACSKTLMPHIKQTLATNHAQLKHTNRASHVITTMSRNMFDKGALQT